MYSVVLAEDVRLVVKNISKHFRENGNVVTYYITHVCLGAFWSSTRLLNPHNEANTISPLTISMCNLTFALRGSEELTGKQRSHQ